jgi:2-keto-4-pentenoate hydratase
MNHKINLQTIANEIKAAQDQCKPIEPLTSRFGNFSNDEAYVVIFSLMATQNTPPVAT